MFVLKVDQKVTPCGRDYAPSEIVAFRFDQLDQAVRVASKLLEACTAPFADCDGDTHGTTWVRIEKVEQAEADEEEAEPFPDPLGVE